jgi:hypothetical protein
MAIHMGNKADVLNQIVTKLIDIPRTMTAAGTLTNLSPALTVGADKKFHAVKAIFPFVGAGSAAKTVTVAIQSDTGTASAYQTLAVSTVGTDAGHGYLATTGNGVAEIACSMDDVKMGANIKVLVTCTFVAANTDTVIGPTLLQFYNAREEPPVNTSMTTLA